MNEPDPRLSLLRPAWLQIDLNAYRHLRLRDRTIENHFTRTHGFRTLTDLQFAEKRRKR